MRDADDGSVLSRQHFLALSIAGLAVMAIPGGFSGTGRTRTFSHRGKEIRVGTVGEPKLIVGGEALTVVSSNGAYRALEFAFSPQPTVEELGRRVAENAGRIAGGF